MRGNETEQRLERARVLILDDEDIVLESLSSFLELETDYEILTFSTPSDALTSLGHAPVDIVISDFLMPEMNGHEFLAEVKKLYPRVPRVLLTGYADKDNAIRAINELDLFQYLEKPWDNERLRLIIRNGIASRRLESVLNDKISELDKVVREKRELVDHDQILREDLKAAQRLQQSLLPDAMPSTNGISVAAAYHPALEIGGDFYDVIELDNGLRAIMMADIQGHGIQAALNTALVKFAFSSFQGRRVDAAEIMVGMNEVLTKGLPSEVFVAALVLVLDKQPGQCQIVNGGLPHPMLYRHSNDDVVRIPATGLLLGLTDNSVYKCDAPTSIRLQTGDRLILYTDGLSETENAAGEFFDSGPMMDTIKSHAHGTVESITEALASEAGKFRCCEENLDDITMLVLAIND